MKKQILLYTPTKISNAVNFQRTKKFSRKPCERSQPSLSKKSTSSPLHSLYVKNSTSFKDTQQKNQDFFTSLLAEVLTSQKKGTQKQQKPIKYKPGLTQRKESNHPSPQLDRSPHHASQQLQPKQQLKIKSLQAQIELKNFQIENISGQITRLKYIMEQQTEKRKKLENQKKQILKQFKQLLKSLNTIKLELNKLLKQKQYLLKQIEFLQKINYDQKTMLMQSYRQKYLQNQIDQIKKQLQKSKSQRQTLLQKQIHLLQQQKFSIQSHYKAIKIANQCLIKQINHTQQNMHHIILNSEQYKKLKNKYIRFLQQYKILRNQYWSLKCQINHSDINNSDDFFSLTVSQIQNDIMLHKSPQTHQLILNTNLNQFHQLLTSNYHQEKSISHDQPSILFFNQFS